MVAGRSLETTTFDAFTLAYPSGTTGGTDLNTLCPIKTYEPTAVAGVVSEVGCAQPCLRLAYDSTTARDITTKVKAYVTGATASTGKIYETSSDLVTTVQCGPSSTIITPPTLANSYSHSMTNFEAETITLEISSATNSQPDCAITTWATFTDADGTTATTLIKSITDDAATSITKIELNDDLYNKVATYEFYIKYTASGGKE